MFARQQFCYTQISKGDYGRKGCRSCGTSSTVTAIIALKLVVTWEVVTDGLTRSSFENIHHGLFSPIETAQPPTLKNPG
jgi:hypothetical protein